MSKRLVGGIEEGCKYKTSSWPLNGCPTTLTPQTPGCKGGVLLVGEKPDKELPGIVGARGDIVKDRGYYLA